MKKVLVAIDFSESSYNALNYILELHKGENVDFHLIHVNPLPYVDAAVLVEADKIMLEESKNRLHKIIEKVKEKYGSEAYQFKIIVETGNAVYHIVSVLKETRYSLLVMGMKGKSNIEKILIGSTTADLISEAVSPVLVVPEKVTFSTISTVLFASDFKEVNQKNVLLKPLVDIASKYEADVKMLYVNSKSPVPDFSESYEGIELANLIEAQNIKLTYIHSDDEDISEGIENQVKASNADLLVLIPHHHNIFERIFKGSISKEMLYHSTIPLLLLHVESKN